MLLLHTWCSLTTLCHLKWVNTDWVLCLFDPSNRPTFLLKNKRKYVWKWTYAIVLLLRTGSSFYIYIYASKDRTLKILLWKAFSCWSLARFLLITFLKMSEFFTFWWVVLNIFCVTGKKCGYLILSGFLHPTLQFLTKTNSFVEAFSCLFTACLSP